MTTTRQQRTPFGVVGGMGPLASAEFVKTIYECSLREREQDSAVVYLHSDPTFPDRTEAFLAGDEDVVLAKLVEALRGLRAAGAPRAAVCCMTIHHLLPRLPEDLKGMVVSLLDVIFDHLPPAPRKHLLLCSSGTRRFRLFETHPRWQEARDRIVMPDEADQHRIHRDLIYPMKTNPDMRERVPLLESLLTKYGVDSFVVGCSEIHMLAKQYRAHSPARGDSFCVDPFAILAEDLAEECL
ncbi:MAG: aspartate/glutamate racemase family protein [Acidobacteria bacterium]|nr:aspartate/glutamate racemase family protein [Acidobacteriota bacterium]